MLLRSKEKRNLAVVCKGKVNYPSESEAKKILE